MTVLATAIRCGTVGPRYVQEYKNYTISQALTSVAAMLKLIILVVFVRAPLLAYGGHSCNCCCNCEFLPRILSRLKFRYC